MKVFGIKCIIEICSVDGEARCLIRKKLLETLESELPRGVIRYTSKVVHIESQDCINSIHLADGTVVKTKVKVEECWVDS